MELLPKPEHLQNLEYMRILTPYIFAYPLVIGRCVLEVGCSSGYGSWLLIKKKAERVLALDLDPTKFSQISQLHTQYHNFNVLAMDAQRLGIKDHNFEVATYFEVIEHVRQPDMLLSEIRRVLRKDGVLLLTTPNRAVRLRPLQSPWNPEHLREYTLKTLHKKLQNHFPKFVVLGIYGEPKTHNFYRRNWQQSLFHIYFGWALSIMKGFIPESVKERIKIHLSHGNSTEVPGLEENVLDMVLPDADPRHWPFYVSDAQKHCLNFFAVCGFDGQVVQRAVMEIKKLSNKGSHS